MTLVTGDPTRIGQYWLAGRLGSGGQGVVYDAYDPEGRRVAIKMLHGTDVGLLQREVTAAQRVSSFCTARLIEADLTGPRPYLVSEYVEGPSLGAAVRDGRTFAPGELHRLATGIATALTAIHDAGVIHRDMKPDNVVLGPDGPRVIDFGLARTLEMSLTASGLVSGTPTYMAPEVFTGERAGAPADVFAWGGIMLFAATGRDPFKAETLGAVMHQVMSVEPDLTCLPETLRPLVHAALRKDPMERPTARALLLALISGDGRLDTARLLAEGGRASHLATEARDPGLGPLAEEAYGMLSPADRDLAAQVFLRLVTVDEDGELSLRRARLSEFPDARGVLRVFAYLLEVTGDEVRLTRPALPHAWPRLRGWIEANRDGLAVHRDIMSAARRWDDGGRRDGDLLTGRSLESALQWAATGRRDITLVRAERDFLNAGAALGRRRARRTRMVSLSLAVLLVASLAATGVAVWQSRVADDRFRSSEAARIAAASGAIRATDPRLGELLSVAAWRLDPSAQTRKAMNDSLAKRESAMFQDPVTGPDTLRTLSADSRTLVSISGGEARLWDVVRRVQVGKLRLDVKGTPIDVALSPSGAVLAVLTSKGAYAWDVRTGKATGTWRFDKPIGGDDSDRAAVRFGTVDRYVMVRREGPGDMFWDLRTGRNAKVSGFWNGAMTPDGSAIFTQYRDTKTIGRFALPGLKLTGTRPAQEPCKYCPDPLAVTKKGELLEVLPRWRLGLTDLAEPDNFTAGTVIDDGPATWNGGRVIFSHDERLLVSATDKEIQLWGEGMLLTTLTVRSASDDTSDWVAEAMSPQPRFDPGGKVLRYLSEDRVFSVDLSALTRPGDSESTTAAVSPDGTKSVAFRGRDGGTDAYLRDGGRRELLMGGGSDRFDFTGAAFSPDGRVIALSTFAIADKGPDDVTNTTRLHIHDAATRKEIKRLTVSDVGEGFLMALSPDGGKIAVQLSLSDDSTKSTLQLWDWKAGRALWSAKLTRLTDVAFSPDGTRLAVLAQEPRLLDTATGKPAGPVLRAGGRTTSLVYGAFTRSGDLVTADNRGRLAVWNREGSPRTVISGTSGSPTAPLAVSPKEDLAALVGGDGKVRLYDLARGQYVGAVPDDDRGNVQRVSFTSDGSRLVTFDQVDLRHEYPIAPSAVAEALCARFGRTLTAQEWTANLPDIAPVSVCGND
ncbi:WD40 repeat domain-containing serine/threonine protein kinase [Nonomuraea rhodomycinica]|uniref:non-specific serine/threonine protein kinase n=1 Tax=Nonomuraea rhodomycinica TaxID=1712872 RepID=A0A7Y6IVH4_9ACTN|nr:WD40 repeat domain-containing serine/threonine protein kinase [Nonomuraea rhodomycinica]NUW44910.1 protein kinase [Nonomuraea rhodomycinica]